MPQGFISIKKEIPTEVFSLEIPDTIFTEHLCVADSEHEKYNGSVFSFSEDF